MITQTSKRPQFSLEKLNLGKLCKKSKRRVPFSHFRFQGGYFMLLKVLRGIVIQVHENLPTLLYIIKLNRMALYL